LCFKNVRYGYISPAIYLSIYLFIYLANYVKKKKKYVDLNFYFYFYIKGNYISTYDSTITEGLQKHGGAIIVGTAKEMNHL
tara:strand:+ start:497 stop:739 length:243 start_codon:yes stop_codon:yes gene_type:complete